MAPLAREKVWVLQPRYFYDPEEPGVALARRRPATGAYRRC